MLGVTINEDRCCTGVPEVRGLFAARAYNPSPQKEDSVPTTPFPQAQVPHITYLLLFSDGIRIEHTKRWVQLCVLSGVQDGHILEPLRHVEPERSWHKQMDHK